MSTPWPASMTSGIQIDIINQRQDAWNSKYWRAPKGMRIKMVCPTFNLSERGSDKTFFQVKSLKSSKVFIDNHIFKESWDFSHLLWQWSGGKDSEDKKTHWHFLLFIQQREARFQEPLWVQLHLFVLLIGWCSNKNRQSRYFFGGILNTR